MRNLFNQMNTEAKVMLDTILSKDKDSLSTEELAFVMARRQFLNDEQRKRFAEELKKHEAGKLFKTDEIDLENLEGMPMATLAKIAKQLKIKGVKDLDKDALIEAIREVKGGKEE